MSTKKTREIKRPFQPIHEGRFLKNEIVVYLLENGGIDMNQLARLDFSKEDRVQFAQLIGYSVGGFQSLSYVDPLTFDAINYLVEGEMDYKEAQVLALTEQINEVKKGLSIITKAITFISDEEIFGEE